MEKDLLNDLIERYLNDELSETERQEVELRLGPDADFRAEVELQRAMQQHMGNPNEVRLRSALDDLWKDVAPERIPADIKSRPGVKEWRGYLAVAAVVLLFVAAWWWFRPSPPAVPEQPASEQPVLPAPVKEPSPEKPRQTPPVNPGERPIAMANPADYAPNPSLDPLIGGTRGGSLTDLEMSSPALNATFRLKNGRITLPVKGTLHVDSMAAIQPFRLFIYSNRPNTEAIYSLPLPFELVGDEKYSVNFLQQIPLPRPGLYYAVVGQERLPDDRGGYRRLWVSKFTVNVKM